MTVQSDSPFASLASLRDSLPDGPASPTPAPEPSGSAPGLCRLFYERKGRGGKEVTIIEVEGRDDAHVAALAAELKKRLGAGGSARAAEILLQGDRRERLRDLLPKLGYRVKG